MGHLMRQLFKILFLLILVSACKNPFKSPSGSGGGGGGSIPSSEDINNYLNQKVTSEIPKCSNLSVEDHLSIRKFPIVKNYGKNTWPDSYSQAISDQLDKDYMKPLMNQKIRDADLEKINCKGYNTATPSEKKKFWALYMSSIAIPESSLNPHTTYKEPPPDNTISAGLLQIDKASGDRWCGDLKKDLGMKENQKFSTDQMLNPKINLQCGMIMMQRSTGGVLMKNKSKNLYQSRPDLEGSLFSSKRWYWKVLENNNSRLKVIEWFKIHAKRQLPFCTRTSHEVNLEGVDYKFQSEKKLTSWPRIGDCENFGPEERKTCEMKNNSQTQDDEEKMPEGSDMGLGEKTPTKDESCNIVDDSSRNGPAPKPTQGHEESDGNNSVIER